MIVIQALASTMLLLEASSAKYLGLHIHIGKGHTLGIVIIAILIGKAIGEDDNNFSYWCKYTHGAL